MHPSDPRSPSAASSHEPGGMNLGLLPQAPVWVLADPHAPAAGQASAIAGRLGLPFRRLDTMPGEPHRPGGPGPGLVLSAGAGAGLRALLLRSRHGCRVVHCASRPLPVGFPAEWLPFDLTVLPQGNAPGNTTGSATGHQPESVTAAASSRMMPVLGLPNVVSPALLARARDLWGERLSHLPHPRVVLLFGGADQKAALDLGRHVASLTRARGGSVMAVVLPEGREAGDALAAGLATCMHLVYRSGEPGEDPTLGFLGHADAVVVAQVGALTLSEACAASAPIFTAPVGRELRATRHLLDRMRHAGQIQLLQNDLSPWSKQPLDEAGRVAREIRTRFGTVSARHPG